MRHPRWDFRRPTGRFFFWVTAIGDGLMKKVMAAIMVAGLFAICSSTALATTYEELGVIYDTVLIPQGMAVIDGNTVNIYVTGGAMVPGGPISPVVAGVVINGEFVGSAPLGDRDALLLIIAQALGIPLPSASSLNEPTSAAATTSRLVFNELVVPTVQTTTEKNRQAQQKAQGAVRTFGGCLRTEWVEKAGDENGMVSGFNLGLAYDMDNFTFGVMLPYDYFNFDSFTANRIGSILFGQYHLSLTEDLEATLTANLNYMFTDFRILGRDDDLNTYGGGLSAGLRYSQELYELGCGVSYQYNQDDVDLADDSQDLVKVGANVGYRVTPDQVVNLFGTWTYDATDYKYDYGDTDYFEIGTEYRANFSDTWALNVGYRKVVDLEDYDSDMVYLGTSWQF
jgi:hypothetical protein